MYAIMYLPEALWVRDIRLGDNEDKVAKFNTYEAAQLYIIDEIIPYLGVFSSSAKEYLYEIMEVEWVKYLIKLN